MTWCGMRGVWCAITQHTTMRARLLIRRSSTYGMFPSWVGRLMVAWWTVDSAMRNTPYPDHVRAWCRVLAANSPLWHNRWFGMRQPTVTAANVHMQPTPTGCTEIILYWTSRGVIASYRAPFHRFPARCVCRTVTHIRIPVDGTQGPDHGAMGPTEPDHRMGPSGGARWDPETAGGGTGSPARTPCSCQRPDARDTMPVVMAGGARPRVSFSADRAGYVVHDPTPAALPGA